MQHALHELSALNEQCTDTSQHMPSAQRMILVLPFCSWAPSEFFRLYPKISMTFLRLPLPKQKKSVKIIHHIQLKNIICPHLKQKYTGTEFTLLFFGTHFRYSKIFPTDQQVLKKTYDNYIDMWKLFTLSYIIGLVLTLNSSLELQYQMEAQDCALIKSRHKYEAPGKQGELVH